MNWFIAFLHGMKFLTFGFLLLTSCVWGQSKSTEGFQRSVGRIYTGKAIVENRIVVKPSKTGQPRPINLNGKNRPIRVSATVANEIETAAKGLYNIENKVVDIKIGNQKRNILGLTSHVGMKGWETRATGMLSKKRGSTFDFNYRFSVEDMFKNGMGHRLMWITKF